MDYEASCIYLEENFDKECDFKVKAENLAKSSGYALWSVSIKINTIKPVGFQTYTNLFNFFCPIP